AEHALDVFLHVFEHFLRIDVFPAFEPEPEVELDAELRFELALEAREIPLLVDRIGRHEAAHHLDDDVAAHVDDRLGDAFAVEQFVALLVDDLALVVRGVVELQQVLADVEVVRLDLALRLFDLAADHAVLDRVVFLHAEHAHEARDTLAHEDADEVVFERKIEAARARVALAARTAAELVVDAPRFMALGADDAKAAEADDFLVAILPCGLDRVALGVGRAFRKTVQLR